MNPLMLFTDGSAHPPTQTGYGAYLIADSIDAKPEFLKSEIQLKRFENTSSSRLEIETLIWALREIQPEKIILYSDSQSIIGLPARRGRLEEQNYCSNKKQPLKNAALYREFFQLIDSIDCSLVKVKGHRRSKEKTRIEQIFTLVDRASRQALRNALNA